MSSYRLPSPRRVFTQALLAALLLVLWLGGCDGGAPGELLDDAMAGAGGGLPLGGEGGAGGQAGAAGAAGGTSALDAGTAGAGGAGGQLDAGADAAPGALDAGPDTDAAIARPRPPCLQSGSQVVLVGDSYMNWVSHTFPADLDAQAGQKFRMYAVGGYAMGSGGIGFIPPQLDQAIADDPDITTVVMTGGGNDILVADTAQFPQGGDCKMSAMSASIPDCQKIVAKALEAADKMLTDGVAKLANEVTHVVYFFYPEVPQPTIVGGTYPNAMLKYAVPMVEEFCNGAEARTGGKVVCHFVDMRPVFMGHPEYFAPTDIHPNLAGSAAMAKAVWQKMKDECLAQPASSGCCEP